METLLRYEFGDDLITLTKIKGELRVLHEAGQDEIYCGYFPLCDEEKAYYNVHARILGLACCFVPKSGESSREIHVTQFAHKVICAY